VGAGADVEDVGLLDPWDDEMCALVDGVVDDAAETVEEDGAMATVDGDGGVEHGAGNTKAEGGAGKVREEGNCSHFKFQFGGKLLLRKEMARWVLGKEMARFYDLYP